ncbi:hypothetical protein KM043_009034 [Ampulex compressa]|nr:hypothetical protein KM043_009034 [Ampulex compressa]
MAGTGDSSVGTIMDKLGLKPVTKCSLAKFYLPAFGVASYGAMSVNVMNPSIIVSLFPKKDVTNFFLGSALLGTGSYLYTREHMKSAQPCLRIVYSATGAVLLTFGSILLWAVLRSIVPPNPALCTITGIGSGLVIIKIGSSYLEFLDGQVVKK